MIDGWMSGWHWLTGGRVDDTDWLATRIHAIKSIKLERHSFPFQVSDLLRKKNSWNIKNPWLAWFSATTSPPPPPPPPLLQTITITTAVVVVVVVIIIIIIIIVVVVVIINIVLTFTVPCDQHGSIWTPRLMVLCEADGRRTEMEAKKKKNWWPSSRVHYPINCTAHSERTLSFGHKKGH